MPSAATTRLRVAQAARNPIMPDAIVPLLADDEEADNLTDAKVRDVLDSLAQDGLVEELDDGRYVHARIFGDDFERRVVAHLAQPRNLASLTAELRSDVTIGPVGEDAVKVALAAAEKAGLVVSLGEQADGEALVDASQDHPEAIDMPGPRAKGLASVLALPHRRWELAGEQFVMSAFAHDALQVT